MLYLKGMRILMFQLSGFYYKRTPNLIPRNSSPDLKHRACLAPARQVNPAQNTGHGLHQDPCLKDQRPCN